MRTLIFILVVAFTSGLYGQKNIRTKVKGFENDSVVRFDDNISLERYVYRNEACMQAIYVKEITYEVIERYVEDFNAFLYLNYVSIDEYEGGENVPNELYFFTPEVVMNAFKAQRGSYPKVQFRFWKDGILYDFTVMYDFIAESFEGKKQYLICFSAQ